VIGSADGSFTGANGVQRQVNPSSQSPSGLDPRWDYPQPHVLYTRVQAGDIDGLQHTNNTVYVDWCQRAAWNHSVALGLDLERYRALDRAMVITYSEFHYLRASQEGQEVAVATWIVEWDGKLTMARRFQVLRLDDGVTLLRAAMRFACVEISSGRPRRLPQEFVDGYGPAVLAAAKGW
jgi:acyl-CoA thioester hydrolase